MFEFLKDKKGEPPALPEGTVRRRYSIEGQVQGVGFRYRAGSPGRPRQIPETVCPHPAQRLYPDHRHPPERHCPRPLGARLLGARLLNTKLKAPGTRCSGGFSV